MKKINLAFSYPDAALEVKLQSVITAMTGNPNFPPPVPELTAATAAATDFSTALFVAKSGSKTDVAIKNQKRETAITAFVTLANLVMLKAAGDDAVLISSAFDLSKDRMPSPPLSKPEIVKVTEGSNAGEIGLRIKKVEGAKMYSFQYTPDPMTDDSQWISQSTTLTSLTFSSLQSSKRYWYRVASMGINEQFIYSDPVSRMVQ